MDAEFATSPGHVTLEEMLLARERRVERQCVALQRFGVPVVSVTGVTPGPVKDTTQSRFVMETARATLEDLFGERGWAVRMRETFPANTGLEFLYAVDAEAVSLKRALSMLEERHVLGRLWDLDVICPRRGAVSRSALSLAPRRCLVCDEPAHACARSRRHGLAELLAAIEGRVNAYRGL